MTHDPMCPLDQSDCSPDGCAWCALIRRVKVETIREIAERRPEPFIGLWLTMREIDLIIELAKDEALEQAGKVK